MTKEFPKSKDFYAGLMFAAIGVAVIVIARNYGMRLGAYIGAGYFPTFVGGLLALVGFAMMVISVRKEGSPIEGGWHFRPLVIVLCSVIAFALLIKSAGLAIAGVMVSLLSSLAGWDFRLARTLVLSVALTALSVAVFVYGLGLPMRVF